MITEEVNGKGVTPTRVAISSAIEYRMGETICSLASAPHTLNGSKRDDEPIDVMISLVKLKWSRKVLIIYTLMVTGNRRDHVHIKRWLLS